jgi:hypothetical protein
MVKRYYGGIISATQAVANATSASGFFNTTQQMQAKAAGNWPGPSGATPDAQFNYVTMLLHGDGTNGAQNNTFLDSSTNNFTITRNGNTTQGSFSPYGPNWSNYFDGSASTGLQTPTSTNLNLTGDFTIECWFNMATGSNYPAIWTCGDGLFGNESSITYNYPVANEFNFNVQTTGIVSSGAINLNTWYHIAVTRSGSTTRMFINGAVVATSSASYTMTNATSFPNTIGNRVPSAPSANYPFKGYISNLRIVKGTAVYTAAFTPSTTPLTAISGTALLTCADNRFVDDSTNNFTLTVNGTPSVQRFNPFGASTAYSTSVIGGSGYFDGTDYLLVASDAAFGYGTGNFTIEAWIYPSIAHNGYVIDHGTAGNIGTIEIGATGGIIYYRPSTAIQTAAGAAPAGAWTHVAVVRSSGTTIIYINGVNSASGADTYNYPTQRVVIGAISLDFLYGFKGYISNLRIVKGTAVYTAAFTPPTAPLTAVSGTSLLTTFINGAIFDNAMMNDLETVGNAQISTSVVKYGTGSISGFNASTSQVISYSGANVGNFGAGDFTVECWINVNSSNNGAGVLTQASAGGAAATSWGFFLNYASGTSIDFYVSNGSSYFANTGGGNVNDSAWHHIAFSRSGSSGKLFLDGTQVGSTLSLGTTALGNGTLPINIGGQGSASLMSQGYIDDIRITKGYARYTANFTPPTAAFPNIGPT